MSFTHRKAFSQRSPKAARRNTNQSQSRPLRAATCRSTVMGGSTRGSTGQNQNQSQFPASIQETEGVESHKAERFHGALGKPQRRNANQSQSCPFSAATCGSTVSEQLSYLAATLFRALAGLE